MQTRCAEITVFKHVGNFSRLFCVLPHFTSLPGVLRHSSLSRSPHHLVAPAHVTHVPNQTSPSSLSGQIIVPHHDVHIDFWFCLCACHKSLRVVSCVHSLTVLQLFHLSCCLFTVPSVGGWLLARRPEGSVS